MPALRERAVTADAIVVLGCRLRPDAEPSRALRRRVALGVQLYRDGRAPLLLLSGGVPPGGPAAVSEAAAMQALAVAAGVPERALLLEPDSRDTAENARNSAAILRARGLHRIVLVSHRTHLLRARPLFHLAGLRVVASAGVPPQNLTRGLLLALYNLAGLPLSLARLRLRG